MQKLYEDNKYPSKTAFLKIAREAGYNKKEVEEFLSKKTEQQVFRKVVIPKGHYNHDSFDFALMSDLQDLSKYSRKNNGYKYVLNILEWKSRYAWSFPLKTKTPKEIAPYIEEVLKELNELPHWKEKKIPIQLMFIRFIVDQGNEFKGAVDKLLDKYRVMKLEAIPKVRRSASPVERFNGTLLKMISRVMVARGEEKWVDDLDDLVKIYNNRVHTTTKEKPVDLIKKVPEGELNTEDRPERRFKVGDVVRKVRVMDIFDKKTTTEKLTLGTYKVARYESSFVIIVDKNGNEQKVVENELVPAVEGEDSGENFERERQTRKTKAKKTRLDRQHIDTKHEGYVDEDGNVKLKARNLPTGGVPKRPKVANTRLEGYVQ